MCTVKSVRNGFIDKIVSTVRFADTTVVSFRIRFGGVFFFFLKSFLRLSNAISLTFGQRVEHLEEYRCKTPTELPSKCGRL